MENRIMAAWSCMENSKGGLMGTGEIEETLPEIDDSVAATTEEAQQGSAAFGSGEMTPEEAFLLQVLSPQDIEELRAKELAQQQVQAEEEELSPEEREAKAEHDALAAAFEMVRSRSNAGKLTTPGIWTAEGLVPEHMIPVDFCDIAFDTIIAAQAQSVERAKAVQVEVGAASTEEADVDGDNAHGEPGDNDKPEGKTKAEHEALEGAADPESPASEADSNSDAIAFEEDGPEWRLDDIKVLEGKQTYLYSSDYMTDAYAHWAFLAEEGDDVLTLADNARTESRLYPRPMLATSLCNKPYYWDQEKIGQTWQVVQDSGEYSDIKTCKASNGDQYFYSTDYLSDAQAKALAEWYSVERYMSV